MAMGLVEAIEHYAHLGPEFLTWLWWRSEQKKGRVKLDGVDDLEVHFGDTLVLEGVYGDAARIQLKGDAPASAPETRAALTENKQVRKCKLQLHFDGADWQAGLDGRTLAFNSIRIPAPPGLPYDEAVALRLELIDRFHEVFSALFQQFLDRRLNNQGWAAESKKISAWIAGK